MCIKKRELGARFRPAAAATQLLPERTPTKTASGRSWPFTSLFLPATVTNAVLAAGWLQAKHIPARVSTLVQHQATQPVAHRFA